MLNSSKANGSYGHINIEVNDKESKPANALMSILSLGKINLDGSPIPTDDRGRLKNIISKLGNNRVLSEQTMTLEAAKHLQQQIDASFPEIKIEYVKDEITNKPGQYRFKYDDVKLASAAKIRPNILFDKINETIKENVGTVTEPDDVLNQFNKLKGKISIIHHNEKDREETIKDIREIISILQLARGENLPWNKKLLSPSSDKYLDASIEECEKAVEIASLPLAELKLKNPKLVESIVEAERAYLQAIELPVPDHGWQEDRPEVRRVERPGVAHGGNRQEK